MQKKISNIIHYCRFWLKAQDKLSFYCKESWEKFCWDFKVIEWSGKKFDIKSHHYTKQALKNKQRAFLSDYVRIWSLHIHGGIYLDTDVEIVRPLDDLCNHRVFLGFADDKNIGTAVIWGEASHPFFKEILDYYDSAKQCSGNNKIITDILYNYWLPHDRDIDKTYRLEEWIVVYPKKYFEPIDYANRYSSPEQNKLHYQSDESYTIHYSNLSWITPWMRCKHYTGVFLEKIWIRKIIKKILIKLWFLDPKIYGHD